MARSRVELFEQIRRDRRDEELSIRELAARHRVHRRTVRQALASAVPPPRKAYPARPRPASARWEVIDPAGCWRIGTLPRKQRHTARRVWQRLVDEHGATVAESTVRAYVARRRIELGADRAEVAVPQTHLPGAEAEVDFGEFFATIAGVLVKLWMFVMRLSHSGRAFHVAFANQAQEAFLEGHVLAFELLRRGARPDPLRQPQARGGPGAARAGTGSSRSGSSRCARHYGFDSFFCQPGQGRRAREGRRGGRDRPVPPPPPGPGPGRRRRWPS